MSKTQFAFDVLFDSDLKDFCTDKELSPIDKKKVLGLSNDFESGKWRSAKFYQFIWNNIAETALTKAERDALISDEDFDSLLIEAAKNLRFSSEEDNGRGGEIAEIFLYGLMKRFYKALPVVPKIYHKQNVQDNAKGADSVHIVLDDSNAGFSIWFGEAKFYSDITDTRLDNVVESVKNALSDEKLKKENKIILGLNELKDYAEDKFETIVGYLHQDTSLDKLKPVLHIPILLIYGCSITENAEEFTDEYKEQIIAYQQKKAETYFKKQINKCKELFKYHEIHFYLILFPVPNKKKIVDTFFEQVSARRKEGKNE